MCVCVGVGVLVSSDIAPANSHTLGTASDFLPTKWQQSIDEKLTQSIPFRFNRFDGGNIGFSGSSAILIGWIQLKLTPAIQTGDQT